jgi:hypothetical protein
MIRHPQQPGEGVRLKLQAFLFNLAIDDVLGERWCPFCAPCTNTLTEIAVSDVPQVMGDLDVLLGVVRI